MDTKETLIKTIKEWVRLDNEIRTLKKEEAKRNIEKKTVSTQLMEIMKNNNIDEFDIKDGQICYSKKHIKKPITKKMLTNILSKYFKGDTEKANEINDYILDNREEVIKESIIRKVNL